MKNVRIFLFLVLGIILLLGICAPANAQDNPINPAAGPLKFYSGGFCYLSEAKDNWIKIHGITVGYDQRFGHLRIDHYQRVTFLPDGSAKITDGTMRIAFKEHNRPSGDHELLLLSYKGNGEKMVDLTGEIWGTFTVASGTGRFEHVTGKGTWKGMVMMIDPANEADKNLQPHPPTCSVGVNLEGTLSKFAK